MSPEAQEAALLESIVPDLEAEGFQVYTHPSAHLLPPFLRTVSPDAIALREDRKLAIEVLQKGSPSDKKLERLRDLLAGHHDWELRVYWISPSNTADAIELVSRRDIEGAMRLVEELSNGGSVGPALLMAWATLEALGRVLLPEKFLRPQTPGRLVEVLAADGQIIPAFTDADR